MSCLNPILVEHPYSRHKTLSYESLKRFSDAGYSYRLVHEYYSGRKIFVPCRKCINCRKKRASDWATRLLLEHKFGKHRNAVFLTLTLDNEHYDSRKDASHLIRRFFDLVRKRFKARCKYFIIDELGEESGRYHFHAIVFDFPMAGLIQGLDLSRKGYTRLSPRDKMRVKRFTDFVNKLWKHGMTRPGNVCSKSIFYIVKYILKTHPLKSDFTPKVWCSPNFGLCYVNSNPNFRSLLISDSADKHLHIDGRKYFPPKYFFSKIIDWNERFLRSFENTFSLTPPTLRYGPYTFDNWRDYRDSCRSFYLDTLNRGLSLPLNPYYNCYCLQNYRFN